MKTIVDKAEKDLMLFLLASSGGNAAFGHLLGNTTNFSFWTAFGNRSVDNFAQGERCQAGCPPDVKRGGNGKVFEKVIITDPFNDEIDSP